MPFMRILACAMVLACAPAAAAPASAESVERMMEVTRSEKMMDSVYVAMEQVMRQAMQQVTSNRQLTPDQRRAIETVPAKYAAAVRAELTWESMKPELVKLYQETFSQEEMDALLAFYASPAGLAMIDKMPLLLQKSMGLSQVRMQAARPKLMKVLEDALNEAGIITR